MAKVGFSASYTGGNIPDGGYVKVKQLKLQQVAKSGTFSLSPSSFSWDAVSYEADNLTDYTLSGSDLHDIALSGTSQRISTDASTLKLIPQTPQGAKVALTLLRSNGKGTLDSELAAVELSPATWDAGQEITTPSERRSSRQKEPASTNSKPRERRGATSPSQTAPLYAVAEAVVR